MENELHKVENTIGYTFKNFDLLQQAFTRRSYSQENGGQNNEVLEFIGDKALDLAVVKILVEKFGSITKDAEWHELKIDNFDSKKRETAEGVLTDIKKELVNKKSLSSSMDKLGFQHMLFLGKGDAKLSISDSDSVKEDLFEAIVGAVAVDSKFNMSTVVSVVKKMVDFESFFKSKDPDENYVGKLQEWTQKHGLGLPIYSYSYDNQNRTVCSVLVKFGDEFNDRTFNEKGDSKAKARMNVSKTAYKFFEKHIDSFKRLGKASKKTEPENPLMILNECAQKGFLSKAEYSFEQTDDGEWKCWAYVYESQYKFAGYGSNKKEAQKEAANELIAYLLKEGIIEL